MVSEHSFAIELKSKDHVKSLSLPSEGGAVLIEGFLGELRSLSFAEGVMLEIEGENGIMFLDFNEKELCELLEKGRSVKSARERGIVMNKSVSKNSKNSLDSNREVDI